MLLCGIPAFSSLIIKLLFDKSIKGFGWKPGKIKYLLFSYILPVIGGVIVYELVWLTKFGILTFEIIPGSIVNKVVMAATVGVIFSIITALGEEIGWRGFLVLELLETFSFTKTSLITSVIWAVYHFPGIIFSQYNSGVETWYAVLFFSIQIIGFSFIMTWLRLKSKSLWPAKLGIGPYVHLLSRFILHSMFVSGLFIFDTLRKKIKSKIVIYILTFIISWEIVLVYVWSNSFFTELHPDEFIDVSISYVFMYIILGIVILIFDNTKNVFKNN